MKKWLKRLIATGDGDKAAKTIAKEVLEKQSTVSAAQAVDLNTVRHGKKGEAIAASNRLLSKPARKSLQQIKDEKAKKG